MNVILKLQGRLVRNRKLQTFIRYCLKPGSARLNKMANEWTFIFKLAGGPHNVSAIEAGSLLSFYVIAFDRTVAQNRQTIRG